jgi:hypothetical protein
MRFIQSATPRLVRHQVVALLGREEICTGHGLRLDTAWSDETWPHNVVVKQRCATWSAPVWGHWFHRHRAWKYVSWVGIVRLEKSETG